MLKFVAVGLALNLVFVCPPKGLGEGQRIWGVNGVFFSYRHGGLASLVFWDGKMLGEFPTTAHRVLGGLVCYKDGRVEAGYWSWEKGKLLWQGREVDWGKVKWAISGGGLYLLDGQPVPRVGQKEGFPPYITRHTIYSFILVHKDRRKLTLGVSKGWGTPHQLAVALRGRYFAFLRLDGGSSTKVVVGKVGKGVHNAVGFPSPPARPNP